VERENIDWAHDGPASHSGATVDQSGEGGGQDRAGAIVNAAFFVLGDSGLEGLTVRAVLKAAGLNRRSFYEHFLGKDDLVLAVFARSILMATDHCRQRVSEMSDPIEALKTVVIEIAVGDTPSTEDPSRSLRRGAALCREHMRLAEARPADLSRALKPLIDLFSELITAGIKQGRVRSHPPARLAALVYNLLSTTVHAELFAEEAGAGDPARRERLADEIWQFCRGALTSS
jgi:AcrR family transcriptional regulator